MNNENIPAIISEVEILTGNPNRLHIEYSFNSLILEQELALKENDLTSLVNIYGLNNFSNETYSDEAFFILQLMFILNVNTVFDLKGKNVLLSFENDEISIGEPTGQNWVVCANSMLNSEK